MAKQAKEGAEIVFSKALIDKADNTIDEALDKMESARGRYMNLCKREREQITAVHEDLAARGIAQRLSKIRLERRVWERKHQTKMAALDTEELKLLKKIAKTMGDKVQLSLFEGLPADRLELDDEDTGGRPQTKGAADLADTEAAGSA